MAGPSKFFLRSLFLSLPLFVLAACSGGGGGGGSSASNLSSDDDGDELTWVSGEFLPADDFKNRCDSVLVQNHWLRSWSHETYLWYDEITDRDPANYSDTIGYFDLLKSEAVTPSGSKKDNFHFTLPTEEYEQQSQSGVAFGYGFQWTVIDRDPQQVYAAYSNLADWPQGVQRGMRVVRIDELYMSNVATDADIDFINEALWPSRTDLSYEFEFSDSFGNSYVAILTPGPITIDSVPRVDVLDGAAGERVGYLLFNDHIAPAEKELVEAVTLLNSGDGVDELILDLRYNGGGYLGIASQLAYMIAGPDATADRVFEELQFNDQHPDRDPVTGELLEPIPFIDVTVGYSSLPENQQLPTLNLTRVFVLTGSGTCSASEAIVNSLRGVDVEVVQIGESTCGKPYGFYPTSNCGTTYFTIQFKGVNDKGFGEYSDGFVPSDSDDGFALVKGCEVRDDFGHPLGDAGEWRLATALNYMESGSCGVYASSYAGVRSLVGRDDGARLVKPQWRENRIMRMPGRANDSL